MRPTRRLLVLVLVVAVGAAIVAVPAGLAADVYSGYTKVGA